MRDPTGEPSDPPILFRDPDKLDVLPSILFWRKDAASALQTLRAWDGHFDWLCVHRYSDASKPTFKLKVDNAPWDMGTIELTTK